MMLTEVEVPKPTVATVETTPPYAKFAVEPLARGFGVTLGNSMRRTLLNALPGAAITWVKIEGVLHEYSVVSHMKEDILEFLLNVTTIRLRSLTDRPGKLRLEVQGPGEIKAGAILPSADFEVVNPELHLATLDSPEATLLVEFNVEQGKGYQPAQHGDGLPIGVLPVDAIFSPIRKVNYVIERTRLGQVTDYERLVLEIWTDGTITPLEALRRAAQVLVDHFFLFSTAGRDTEPGAQKAGRALSIPAEQYNMLVERLELSARPTNCLKRAGLNKVGEVLEKTDAELLAIRNFGEKSLEELHQQLRALNLLPHEEVAAPTEAGGQNGGASGDAGTVESSEEESPV